MIVVSNTSPLCYLALIDAADALPKLFGEVLIPPAVRDELLRPETPEKVRQLLQTSPSWLLVRAPSSKLGGEILDVGELEAIALSLEVGADALLIDDRKGRSAAERRGLRAIGVIAVLEAAAKRRLLDIDETIARLRVTTFRAAPTLLDEAIRRVRDALT